MDGEFDYIVSSLPQRRQRDFDNRKTEKQIFTKLVFRHGLVKVAMRRGNHSAIYRDRLPATHALNHLFLEETQYLHLELGHEIANFINVLLASQSLRRTGSAALNLAYVAAGRYDAYWATSTKPWDIAAGVLLVREAGGIVTGIDGGPLDLAAAQFIAAANGRLHAAMRELVLCSHGPPS